MDVKRLNAIMAIDDDLLKIEQRLLDKGMSSNFAKERALEIYRLDQTNEQRQAFIYLAEVIDEQLDDLRNAIICRP